MEKKSSTQRTALAQRLAMIIVVLAVAATLAGCGLIKIGYRNGETVGVFWLDRYLDLDGEQKDFVKPRLHRLLAWHRSTQLPDYAAFAQELQQKAPQPMTGAEVATLGDVARRRAYVTIDRAIPDLADLALHLSSDNVAAMQKRFAKDDDKWRDEFMKGDAERQRKARYEKSLERVEEWYGRFSGDQRTRIRALSDARPLDNDVLLADRQRRERDLVALLSRVVHEKPSRDAVIAMMTSYAERFDHNPEPERAKTLETWRRSTEEMDAQIHNLSTAEQRQRAVAKLQDWIDDFRALAADPG